MPFGYEQSFQKDEPNRQISRAAMAQAQSAQATADAAMALALHAQDVANNKLASFATANAVFNGPDNGQLMTASVPNPAGPGICLSHGQLYSGGFPNVYMQDSNGNQIAQTVSSFNTKQGTKNVFISVPASMYGITPETDGGAVVLGSSINGATTIQMQLDLFVPQKEQV